MSPAAQRVGLSLSLSLPARERGLYHLLNAERSLEDVSLCSYVSSHPVSCCILHVYSRGPPLPLDPLADTYPPREVGLSLSLSLPARERGLYHLLNAERSLEDVSLCSYVSSHPVSCCILHVYSRGPPLPLDPLADTYPPREVGLSLSGEFCLVLVYTHLLRAADTSRFSPLL